MRRILTALLVSAALSHPAWGDDSLTLMAYGDSLVHGYGLPQDQSFPAQLQQQLSEAGYDVNVINAGNSGDVSASGLSRLGWSLADPPDAMILVLGANDGLRGLEPSETEANLREIIETLEARGIPLLLAGMMAPRNFGDDYAAEFDAIYPRLSADYDLVFYPFFLEGVALEPEMNQGDGIHPNAAGVALIVEKMMPKVEALIARSKDKGDGPTG